VALTRARDRLYLASEVKDARWRAFGGSLGDILPPGVKACFEAAGTSPPPETTEWTAASGHVHTFRVCTAAPVHDQPVPTQGRTDLPPDSLAPLVDPFELPRVAVTKALAPLVEKPRRSQMNTGSRSLTGTLVHRLFERFGTLLSCEADDRICDELGRLIRDEEIAEAGDVEPVFAGARNAYVALCEQRTLAQALESGDALFEVPFSVRPAASQIILRGTFDCLIRRRDGGITVLELKTGKPAPEHDRQLEMYLTAARAMFPGAPVEGKLVYAGHADLDDRPLDS
jgi:ATP-dependent exoDNAse (exonuclease V) beta subunit